MCNFIFLTSDISLCASVGQNWARNLSPSVFLNKNYQFSMINYQLSIISTSLSELSIHLPPNCHPQSFPLSLSSQPCQFPRACIHHSIEAGRTKIGRTKGDSAKKEEGFQGGKVEFQDIITFVKTSFSYFFNLWLWATCSIYCQKLVTGEVYPHPCS